MGTQRRNVFGATATVLVLLFLFVPIFCVILFSFHKTASLSFPFEGFSLRWYEKAFGSSQFVDAMVSSFIVASVVALTTLVLGTAGSYALTRMPTRVRGVFAFVIFLPLTLPGLFLGVGLLVFLVRLHIQLSLFTIALGHFILIAPFFMLIAGVMMQRLDRSLEETAQDLGASPTQVFWRVVIPQIWTVLLGATVLAFTLSLDEFIVTLFVAGTDSTLPLYIWSLLRRTVDPSINTVSTMLLTVTAVLWLLAGALALWAARRKRAGFDQIVEADDLRMSVGG